VDTTVGPHTVGETAGTGTSLAAYTEEIGGDCAADGTVTLKAGESATCTITNVAKAVGSNPAKLTVNKVCVPSSDDGRFDLLVHDNSLPKDSLTFSDVECGGTTGAVVLPAGSYTVEEAGGTGTSLSDYATAIAGDCLRDGSI